MKTTKILSLIIVFFCALIVAQAQNKPRIIIITDMTHDDGNSLIRYLHYANEFKLEAMIVTPQLPDYPHNSLVPWNKAQTIINAYGQVENQLRKHHPDFPTATAVRSVTKKGRGALPIIWMTNGQRFWDWIGEGNTPNGEPKDSEGSEFLQTVFENPDPSPIFVQFWGGPITFMQAMYRYKQEHTTQELSTLLSKLYIYDIVQQDITVDMMLSITTMKSINCGRWDNATGTYGQPQLVPASFASDGGHFWDYLNAMSPSEVQGHGALSNLYDGGGEGDTPLLLVNISQTLGLNDARIPTLGSWGNMYPKIGSPMPSNYHATCKGSKSELTRWKPEAKNSFLARLDWAIKNPGNVNRPPKPSVNGDNTNKIMYIDANPGTTINLNASASSDPDGNSFSYKWFQYTQADSYSGTVSIGNSTSNQVNITLPGDLGDKNIHIVLELRDNGSPNLVAYKRIIAGKGVKDPFGPTTPVAVTDVSVNPTSTSIPAGTSTTLSATISPSNATNKNVTWSSNNTSVATVNSYGQVTGVSIGTATITVTTQDGNKTASSVITVTEPLACNSYQAESNYSGSGVTVATGNPGYTGNGYVDYGGLGTYAEWNISVASAGNYQFKLRYANGSSGNRQSAFKVNGSAQGNIAFTPTGGWATWNIVEFTANLNSGNNVIQIEANTSAGGPNLDAVEVCGDQVTISYSLAINSPNGSVIKNPNQPTYARGTEVTLTATPNSGYTFNNWSGDANGSVNPLTVNMNADKTITANFVPVSSDEIVIFPLQDSYVRSDNASTVYGTADPGELNLRFRNPGGSSESIRYTYLKFQVPSIPSGKALQSATLSLYGYNYNSSQNTVIDVVHAGNSWSEESLTWNNKPSFLNSGTVTFGFPNLNNSSGSFEVDVTPLLSGYSGQTITLALRINGYVNDELIKLGSKENSLGQPAPSLTLSYEGQSTTNYTLTTNSPNGSITRNPNNTTYASGTQVTLTANANSGYSFTGWSGDASGTTNPLVITMNANKSITANFTLQTLPDCILANPSFESDLQNWTINSGTIGVSSNATDGVKSARLYGSNSGMEQGYTHSVAQGTTVTVSFDAYIAGSVSWAGVGLDFRSSNNTDILKENIQITNTSWQAKTIVANAPVGTEKLVVWAYTGSGELFVDDFCISGTGLKSDVIDVLSHKTPSLNVDIYPIPVINGYINLFIENNTEDEGLLFLKVFDISGRNVYNQNITVKGESTHTIDCSNLKSGLYFFKIIGNGVTKTIKVDLH